jgi:hypothetical protein
MINNPNESPYDRLNGTEEADTDWPTKSKGTTQMSIILTLQTLNVVRMIAFLHPPIFYLYI